jgi:hypothetical protein
MNKRSKTTKLPFHHERIRTLDAEQLSIVAGGAPDNPSSLSDCISCRQQREAV